MYFMFLFNEDTEGTNIMAINYNGGGVVRIYYGKTFWRGKRVKII